MPLARSWIESANSAETQFPLNNLPYGVFATDAGLDCGIAIGDMILNVSALERDSRLDLPQDLVFVTGAWNDFMALGPAIWADFRGFVAALLAEGSEAASWLAPYLVPMRGTVLHMPFLVSEYTDFYAGRHHAFNVGSMFRDPENALPPNWLSIPIGYNGRASSVLVSGSPVRRPWGQIKAPDADLPVFAPCRKFDFELEMGAIVGQHSEGMVSVEAADAMIFGYVLLNDWSARDIQAWEYQPLGPFQAKASATTISPWIVTGAALEPFRVSTPERERPLLPYLQESRRMLYDIHLEVRLAPHGKPASMITRTNYREMYYSAAQQLCHHTTSGCPMEVGDLLGSGTISGPDKASRGSLLELAWGGTEPLVLDTGESRSFLEDGDCLTLAGWAEGDGYRIGFGDCAGTVLPAHDTPAGAGR